MKRVGLLCSCLLLLLLLQASFAEQPSADDFLPPVRGGTTTVRAAASVKVEANVVRAATPGDAANAAMAANEKNPQGGCRVFSVLDEKQFPSGWGIIATGRSRYDVMENPVATRKAQRQAYLVAYAQAKALLAKSLTGPTVEAKEIVALSNSTRETAQASQSAGSAAVSDVAVITTPETLVSSFVIYAVDDDAKTHTVSVTIASTPATAHRLTRQGDEQVIEADSLKSGLDALLDGCRTGPPLLDGGRIISVSKTGEAAYVGFGSAVVSADPDATIQAEYNETAKRIASANAQVALCELIKGNLVSSVETVTGAGQSTYVRSNPAADGVKRSFESTSGYSQVITMAKKGILPPGVRIRVYMSDDNAWAYAVAFYSFRTGSNAGKSPDGEREGSATSGMRDSDNPNVPRPSQTVKPLPAVKPNDNGL